ncbi:MAG: class II aldolase/adducin family protein [Brevinematales bacterium]|nr:class II aldolase/adducin family protein [Brevinematales bacterium]
MNELENTKREIAEYARLLYERGYVTATEGNISVRLDNGATLITASGIVKGLITPEGVTEIGPSGEPVPGAGKPSTERFTHLEIYKQNPSARAIVHAHPPYVLLCNSLGIELTAAPFTAESAMFLRDIRVAPFALPSTSEGAEAVRPIAGETNIILLDRHGTLTYGETLVKAFSLTEILEKHAKLCYLAAVSGRTPAPFDEDTLRRLRDVKY